MVALVVVVIDEGFDLGFKIAGQEVVFQQDAVLQGLMPAFDLALGLRVIRCATRVLHAFVLEPFRQFPRDITGPVVTEQTWFVDDVNLIATDRNLMLPKPSPACPSRLGFSCWCRVSIPLGTLLRNTLPGSGDDVAAVIVQDRAEIEPAPADDL